MQNNLDEVEILLVEDNLSDAELVIRALAKVQLADKVIHLKDGAEALDFLFGEGEFADRDLTKVPKVILLDIKMPRVNGIEVLRKVKSHPGTRSIPIVIMTSSKEEQDIFSSYELGVNSFVVKPVDFNGFAKAVTELGLYWVLTNQPPVRKASQ
jgi:two-component system response regulator